MKKLKVLVACEYSGTVRDAFSKKGHDAWSCDLLPTDKPGNHYESSVEKVICNGWDLMIAHPPCTYLCNSGVCHLHTDEERWRKMKEASLFFKMLLDAPIPMIAIENPIMHRYGKAIIGTNQSQVIQPYMFGHAEQKATCLWLKNLPLLKPTNNVYEDMMQLPINERQRLHYLPPGPDRWKERSKTFEGIAEAMAEQWSDTVYRTSYQTSLF